MSKVKVSINSSVWSLQDNKIKVNSYIQENLYCVFEQFHREIKKFERVKLLLNKTESKLRKSKLDRAKWNSDVRMNHVFTWTVWNPYIYRSDYHFALFFPSPTFWYIKNSDKKNILVYIITTKKLIIYISPVHLTVSLKWHATISFKTSSTFCTFSINSTTLNRTV